jgi:hypothetical protein
MVRVFPLVRARRAGGAHLPCILPRGSALRQVNFQIRELFAYLKQQRAAQPLRCAARR